MKVGVKNIWVAIPLIEFLSCLKTSDLSNHLLKLKIGTTIMLIRNLDQSEVLCNDTRLTVTKLVNHVIEANIISGTSIENTIYISRMSLSLSQSPWSFKLIRIQFSIIMSFAMTMNKSQGLSLDYVGFYLSKNVFSHGQFYITISRVKSKAGLKILIQDKNNNSLTQTTNIFFKFFFHNMDLGTFLLFLLNY